MVHEICFRLYFDLIKYHHMYYKCYLQVSVPTYMDTVFPFLLSVLILKNQLCKIL